MAKITLQEGPVSSWDRQRTLALGLLAICSPLWYTATVVTKNDNICCLLDEQCPLWQGEESGTDGDPTDDRNDDHIDTRANTLYPLAVGGLFFSPGDTWLWWSGGARGVYAAELRRASGLNCRS